ncbi:MAG TPA: hydroxyacid-oxoacid transhydrogenase [Solirubrobacterales bacterium]|nr:hydroxyacid-oxoacid transhydrogenase [Solirubrobacterales bacterium]
MAEGRETVFTIEATPLSFGAGAVADAGWHLQRLGVRRALLVTDPGVVAAGHVESVRDSITAAGIELTVYDQVRIEPTLTSIEQAAEFAREARPDGFVSVGGGSVIDTAKVACLLASHPGSAMDFINQPIGAGRQPPGPLLPHLAIPTTAGTGSEATTVAVLDLPELKVKTGISHRYLRPAQGIVDPELTATLGPEVTASTGLDVVCHAAESYISRPFDARPRPASPDQRPPYQGSNPVADVWSARALELGGQYLRRAVADPADLEARGMMMLAASMAGVGFGSAGVHIPHACAYPIAGLKHAYQPPGYPTDHPFVPHGHSVIVTAPAAFNFTYEADPARHHHAARLLGAAPGPGAGEHGPPDGGPTGGGAGPAGTGLPKGPAALPGVLIELMRAVGAPNGIAELGYAEADIPDLVEGAFKQQRLLAIAPREPTPAALSQILHDSLRNW